MSKEDHEDVGVGRVIEAQGLAKIFLSTFDELRNRKFNKFDALNVSREMLFAFMNYKSNLDAMAQSQVPEGAIMLIPEGGDGHDPNCPNAGK